MCKIYQQRDSIDLSCNALPGSRTFRYDEELVLTGCTNFSTDDAINEELSVSATMIATTCPRGKKQMDFAADIQKKGTILSTRSYTIFYL